MPHELKTTSLKEIVKKCNALGWNVDDVKISYQICEDISRPDDYYVKLFIKNPKADKAARPPKIPKGEKIFNVRYTSDCGWKGEALWYTINAVDENAAIKKAMSNPDFTKHIHMPRFNKKFLSCYIPTHNVKLGEIFYFEGDERL